MVKYWRLVRIALYVLGNQTCIDGDMPLRLFSYDGIAYWVQLLADKEMKEKTGRIAPRYRMNFHKICGVVCWEIIICIAEASD